MSKFTLVALFSLLAIGAFTGCSDETVDEEARWRNYRQDQEIARLREENRRKPTTRTVVVREKDPEIFEPVRNTPSTINDPLYERN